MTPRANARLPKIPEMTIRRLSVYTRCLLQLEEDGVKTVSSQELAERFNLNSAQVRKDLAYFGEFGVRGIGYYVSGLKAELQRILGLDRDRRGAVGCGPVRRRSAGGRGHQGHLEFRAGADQSPKGRAIQERGPLDRARDPLLLPLQVLPLTGRRLGAGGSGKGSHVLWD